MKADSFYSLQVHEHATIVGAAFFGSVSTGPLGSANSTTHGMSLEITQGTETILSTLFVPAHYADNWVTVEEWGWSPPGGYEAPNYQWQYVGPGAWVPPVFDENGNVIQEGYYESLYDWVYVGTIWVPTDPQWVVTGTHQENQPVWVQDSYQPYEGPGYGAPIIHQKATRSDANWAWEVPTQGGTPKTIMRLWDGGLSLPRLDGSTGMSLTPSALIYSLGSTSTQVGADVTTYLTQVTNGTAIEESKAEVRPELVRLTRTETSEGNTSIGMTQIAAKSASFGGVVTVEGNLKVQGVLRVAAGGDLSMGEFTTSPAGIDPP
ncbi:MAG: hypothetical protein ACO1TE_00560 [Prosthecobacter sp.]